MPRCGLGDVGLERLGYLAQKCSLKVEGVPLFCCAMCALPWLVAKGTRPLFNLVAKVRLCSQPVQAFLAELVSRSDRTFDRCVIHAARDTAGTSQRYRWFCFPSVALSVCAPLQGVPLIRL